jgi:hypothetical protein
MGFSDLEAQFLGERRDETSILMPTHFSVSGDFGALPAQIGVLFWLVLQNPSLFTNQFRYSTRIFKYSTTPVSMGNTFQVLPRLRETIDDTERHI